MGKYDAPALGERAQYLLKTLVERYISEGQPVGSRTLSRYSGLDLSPASIRNIMSDLEEMGFIASPHTSAGRVPTAKGYRFFVDSLLVIRPLETVEIHQLEDNLHPDNPSRLIASASHLLSDLTHFAGIVRAPQRSAAFRHLEFMALSEKRVLLIIVTADGDVQNRILFTERSYTPAELAEATNFINHSFAGQTLDDIRSRVHEELKQIHRDMSGLMLAAIEAGTQALTDTSGEVVVSGEHNLLKVHDLSSDMGKLRQLFAVFEEKTGLLQLLDASRSAHGVQIFIGGESGVAPLDECSVVTASYTVKGQVVGTIGVVGPTRMAYERVIPIVDITAKLLSSALSQP